MFQLTGSEGAASVTLIKALTWRTALCRSESQDAHPLDEVLSPCTALSETHVTPEHRWVFPLDKQITTGLSLTPLTSGRNSQSFTDTEQDSLFQLIASVSFKKGENNHFHLLRALIFFPCLLVSSEEAQSSLTSLISGSWILRSIFFFFNKCLWETMETSILVSSFLLTCFFI